MNYPDFNFPNFKSFVSSADANQKIQHRDADGRPSFYHCAVGQFNASLEDPAPQGVISFVNLTRARFPLGLCDKLTYLPFAEAHFVTYGDLAKFMEDL